ncbi:hypothetical protein FEQ05_01188 [Burkholderia pseudomultivorans]|uniref:Uncharacterized protein n=1 Tax=Burkholderia pseudomultivorans TaxID=1207504 RepID=A0ABU2E0J6_9BURK|nr:hypothetical protein [Burkholderia pseudomultivorans]MDR8736041.1 hypothetical protein [Burkholderia pseudomultivorans]MDR8742017.1 hypothetical protein [Burkholderia pseudomultivorans]MDR8753184.1 hypothetical protein [Burkholderia pseudomultivorans]MDR8778611.1 hypothetical protein [Burkholderia pseudomultivorans]
MGRMPAGKPGRPAQPERNMRYLISPRPGRAGAVDTFQEAAPCRHNP